MNEREGRIPFEKTIRKVKRWRVLLLLGAISSLVVSVGLVTNAIDSIFTFWRKHINPPVVASGVSTAPEEIEQVRLVLMKQIEELDGIEKEWENKFTEVEPLAMRVAVIADELRSESAIEIRRSLESFEAREVAKVTRRELKTMLELLTIRRAPKPSSTQ